MTIQESRMLGELLRDLEHRVNLLQEAMKLRFDVHSEQEWISVGDRLRALEDDLR